MYCDQALGQVAATRCGGAVLVTARLVPVIAFNLINYVAALSGISWWTFLWATGLGILPLTILLSILGDQVLSMPFWAWARPCSGRWRSRVGWCCTGAGAPLTPPPHRRKGGSAPVALERRGLR
ncbi:MAG TPA: VTT domain-containing protein [Burkholderiales bacterium]|nr:VTT domain-containing protein [Burkholderiales bacterium]